MFSRLFLGLPFNFFSSCLHTSLLLPAYNLGERDLLDIYELPVQLVFAV